VKQGVTLIAVGNDAYLRWAVNMAASIRYHSPGIQIQLIASYDLAAKAESKWFDIVTVAAKVLYTDIDGRFFPAKLKTGLYNLLCFDETVYLDVDGCVVKDISPLFNSNADFGCEIQGIYTIDQGAEFKHMKWAKPGVVWEHYGLKPTDKLPAINSSYMFIRKSERASAIFSKAYDLLMNNPLPVEKQWLTWGKPSSSKNIQPDELYFNLACTMLGTMPDHQRPLYFRTIIDKFESLSLEKLRDAWYGVGLFGNYDTNHVTVKEAYDRQMFECFEQLTGSGAHIKATVLGRQKFVST